MVPEIYRPVVDSTMDEARRLVTTSDVWASRDIFVVRAGHQTAGRGRRGTLWYDRPGKAILATIVLRHDHSRVRFDSTLPLRAGLGVCRGLETVLSASVPVLQLKWPNDVLVRDRKLAGILVESNATRAFIGIGINLAPVDPPGEGLMPISMRELFPGTEEPRGESVWPPVLREVQRALVDDRWHHGILQRLAWRDRPVEIEGRAGRIVGLSLDGSLEFRTERGTEEKIVTGTLRDRSLGVNPRGPLSSAGAVPPVQTDDAGLRDRETRE